MKKTLHKEQIGKQNKRKHKAIHAQTTAQVIAQVKGEFRARGYGMTLSKNSINRYVALGMVGMFPLARGYKGTIDLLVLAVESYIQVCQFNSIVAK